MAMIETKKLRKVFGPIEAVKGVSFRVDRGEVLGFLGPNGAGKSTVMRMITCFLEPTSGTATVGDHDIQTDSMEVRKLIGYVPESNPVYGDMTANSFLRFVGEIRGYSGKELEQRVERVVDMCWLADVRHQPLETLSKGYKRRVGLAQALIHDPPVLILDEPTDGLDPNQKHEVRSLIKGMAADKAIIISTHILEEVDSVCTRAIVIAQGRIVADGTPAELRSRSPYHGAVRLGVRGDGVDVAALEALPGVASVERLEDDASGASICLIVPAKGQSVSNAVVDLAAEKRWKVDEVHVEEGRLDEVFRQITTKEGNRK